MKSSRLILFVIVLVCPFGVCGRNPFIRTAQAQAAPESESTDLESIIPGLNQTGETDTNAAPVEAQPAAEPAPAPTPEPAPTPAVVPPEQTQRSVQPSQAPPPAPAPKEDMIEIIEFQNAPVFAVLDYYARMTGRSIISAPNLAGTINFRSQSQLTKSEALQALDSVLAINGIGTVPMGEKFLKVVQIATAKQEGLPFAPDGHPLPPADKLVTQIIPLKHAEASEVVPAIQPYLHPYGQLMALTKSNSILITETGANINQMLEILKYIDQPSALRMETRVYILRNAKAAEVVSQLQSIIQEAQQIGARATGPTQAQPPGVPPRPIVPRPPTPGGAPALAAGGGAPAEESLIEGKVILTSDDRTNKIFVLSRPANFKFFEDIIAELDAKVDPDVVIKVIPLQYADAQAAAGLLNALVTGAAPPVSTRRAAGTTSTTPGQPPRPAIPPPVPAGGAGQPGAETGAFLEFAEGVRILPDERTNSLLVMATRADIMRIESLIHDIDTSVAQVLIEVVIGEINLGNTLDLSVNTIKRLFQEGQVRQAGVINTTENPLTQALENPNNPILSNIFPQAMLFPSGLTYLISFQNLKLDTVVRALATSTKFKVLSTPIIQTLHNQEGSILVGESRPVITSTVASPVQAGNIAVNSNVEYIDIAIELKVTPRINPDGFVTMDIEQKINDVGGNILVNGTPTPIITKREAKSQVTVKNGGTIVLGGLIRENKTTSDSRVPFFGDIPIVGTLFKGQTNIKGRTELILFIRPSVLRTPAEELAEAVRRTEYFRAGMGPELQERLEKAREALSAPSTNTNQTAPPPTPNQSSTEPGDIRSAKMKALEESQNQPDDPGASAAQTN